MITKKHAEFYVLVFVQIFFVGKK